jgi:hypothetical protein
LFAHGGWFSPGTPASSTTKTGRRNIAESGTTHQNSNQITLNHLLSDFGFSPLSLSTTKLKQLAPYADITMIILFRRSEHKFN